MDTEGVIERVCTDRVSVLRGLNLEKIWVIKLFQERMMGNYPPTPPLRQHFALSEK